MQRLIFLVVLFIFISCEYIVEPPNIQNENIVLEAPFEGVNLEANAVRFSWQDVDVIDTYRLQVASPSFENAGAILIDTLLEKVTFTDTLASRKFYEWRVRGENSLHLTPYASREFSIATLANLGTASVTLLAPSDNITLAATTVAFTWQAVTDAENYHLQLATPAFEGAAQILRDTLLTATHFQETGLATDTRYQWRVRAENYRSRSPYVQNSFEIKIVPTTDTNISTAQLTLFAPFNNATLSSTSVNLSWNPLEGAKKYQVQVARPNFTTPLELSVDMVTTETNVDVELSAKTSYQWRVKALNDSFETPYVTRSFKVN